MHKMSVRRLLMGSALCAVFSPAVAADDGTHAGTVSGQFVKQEAQPLGSPDHVVIAEVAKGTNKSTGKSKFMDGAQVLWSETVELNRGNGSVRGLVSFFDDKSSVTSEYTGTVVTTMVNGKPHTTGQGIWKIVGGTGAFSEAKDVGTFFFTPTSPTEFSGEWKGTALFPE